MGRPSTSPFLKRSEHGSVVPFTRHRYDCPFRQQKTYNECPCPKHVQIYRNADGFRTVNSLGTGSWDREIHLDPPQRSVSGTLEVVRNGCGGCGSVRSQDDR